MKIKKIIAVVVCLAMMMVQFQTMSANTEAANTETAGAYYVSASGSDENAGTSAENAFATVKNAVAAIETADGSNTIKILGDYSLTAADLGVIHAKTVVIEGNDDTAKLSIGDSLYAGGPFTFQNITLYYAANQCVIYANGHEVVFGEGVTTAGSAGSWDLFQNMVSTGGYANAVTYGAAHKLTINDGDYYRLYVGDNALADNAASIIPGLNFTMNNGFVYQFLLGGDGWGGRWGTNSYTDDVNLTFNGGSVGAKGVALAKYSEGLAYFQGGTDFNGNALQIIMNNGTKIALDGITADNVAACNGSLYILKCANQQGSTLEATDEAGTYQVNGDMAAVATDGTTTYTSEDGTLKVPAGTYQVSFEERKHIDTFYVSTTGDDTNDGTSAETAFATVKKAVEAIEAADGSNTIKIVGAYELTSADFGAVHTKNVVLEGNNAEGQLNIACNLFAGGPLTFQNITLYYTANNCVMYANGHDVVFGSGMKIAGSGENAGWWSFQNMISTGGYADAVTYNAAHELTINSGDFYRLYVGDSALADNTTSIIPGLNFTMNGGYVFQFLLGGDGWGGRWGTNSYTDDVNLTFNGGSVGTNGVALAKYSEGLSYFQGGTNFNNNALQIIMNNGTQIALDGITADNVAACNGGLYILRCENQPGNTLAATEKAGTYQVNGGKTAVATAKSDGKVYISENGVLTVPAGEYDVTYSEKPYYTNNGENIEFLEDCTLDLSGMKHTNKEGQLFVGWVNADGNGVKGTTFTKGTILNAKYIAFDVKNDFVVSGKQLKKADKDVPTTLRFHVVLKNEAYQELSSAVTVSEVGGLSILSETLGLGDLTVDTQDAEKTTITGAASNFGITASNIEKTNYKKQYTIKGYIRYMDLNGYAQVLYTDYVVGSVYETAKGILAMNWISDKDRAYFEAIRDHVEVTMKEEYLGRARTNVSIDWTTLGMDNPYAAFYRFDNGLVVREVNIDTGLGGDTVEIVQATDFHYNYCNAKDFEEKNPSIMSTYYQRGLYPNGASAEISAKCMEYGSFFDQTVVTGDTLDYMSWGAMELMQKHIWDPYPDTLALLGNHDPVRVMGLPNDVQDPTTVESRFEILQQNWKHDIYYTSRLIKEKVLVIQMDNGQNKFWDVQVDKLRSDLERARVNGYTVLIFTHEALSTGNPEDKAGKPIYKGWDGEEYVANFYDGFGDQVGYNATGATKEVYDLITSNADVVKGVFTGHQHVDYYTEIQAKTSDGTSAVIPQYSLCGCSATGEGHVLKINVK